MTTSPIGLGCESTSIDTIRAAVDAGITLLDTGDFYGMGANEELIRSALRPGDREKVVLSVKFGGLRDPKGQFVGIEGRPAHVKSALAYSLQRLGTDHVDIYRPARLAPDVPIEDTVGAIAEMVQAGYVRQVGLSEVGAETIRRAHAVHPITDVQIEYSLFSRSIEHNGILATCRELGIGVTAYGVLAHGLLTGSYRLSGEPPFHLPWFHAGNLETNLGLVEALRTIADAKAVPVARLAIAWVLAQGPDIVAVVGAGRPERITEAMAAAGLTLSAADLAAIEAAVPPSAVAGTRYAAPLMKLLDSER